MIRWRKEATGETAIARHNPAYYTWFTNTRARAILVTETRLTWRPRVRIPPQQFSGEVWRQTKLAVTEQLRKVSAPSQNEVRRERAQRPEPRTFIPFMNYFHAHLSRPRSLFAVIGIASLIQSLAFATSAPASDASPSPTVTATPALLDGQTYDPLLGSYRFSSGDLIVIGRSSRALYYYEPHHQPLRAAPHASANCGSNLTLSLRNFVQIRGRGNELDWGGAASLGLPDPGHLVFLSARTFCETLNGPIHKLRPHPGFVSHFFSKTKPPSLEARGRKGRWRELPEHLRCDLD